MSELVRAGEWLAHWAGRHDLPKDAVFALRLCLEEIFANIVMHAFAGGEHAVRLALRCEAEEAVMTIIDDGTPFDPLAAPPPTRPTGLADAEPGGRGLLLVKSYANRLAYRREDGRNHLVLAIRLADGKPKPNR